MSDRVEGEIERWVYQGKLLSKKHHWKDAEGRDLIYDKVSGAVPGGIYEIEVVRRADNNVQVYPASLKYTGETVSTEERIVLEVENERRKRQIAREALERKASREPAINSLIAPIVGVSARMRTQRERQALAEYVTERILMARYER